MLRPAASKIKSQTLTDVPSITIQNGASLTYPCPSQISHCRKPGDISDKESVTRSTFQEPRFSLRLRKPNKPSDTIGFHIVVGSLPRAEGCCNRIIEQWAGYGGSLEISQAQVRLTDLSTIRKESQHSQLGPRRCLSLGFQSFPLNLRLLTGSLFSGPLLFEELRSSGWHLAYVQWLICARAWCSELRTAGSSDSAACFLLSRFFFASSLRFAALPAVSSLLPDGRSWRYITWRARSVHG